LLGGNGRFLEESSIKVAPRLMLEENSFIPYDFPFRRQLAKVNMYIPRWVNIQSSLLVFVYAFVDSFHTEFGALTARFLVPQKPARQIAARQT
jgi:hypothetical protein